MTYCDDTDKHSCPGYKNHAASNSTDSSINSVPFFMVWDDMEKQWRGRVARPSSSKRPFGFKEIASSSLEECDEIIA